MEKLQRYIEVYKYAKEFLGKIVDNHPDLNKDILNDHLRNKSKFNNLSDANKRLIETLSNRNMMTSVINFLRKEKVMKQILCDYNPKKILKKLPNSDELFMKFRMTFEIKNVESKRNLWRKFSDGIISGSKFLSSFNDKKDFDNFVKTFSLNKFTKAALPMLLSDEIDGFGFVLACDFLKELGYRDYPKPDVHLIKIFHELGLSETSNPYDVYKSIIEMSEIVGDDAYTVDKTFWLISSGRFYLVDVEVGRNRDKFIKEMKVKLK